MLYHPFQGNYKQLNNNATSDDKVDEYEIVAIAKRLNISIDDMKNFCIKNLLISSHELDDDMKLLVRFWGVFKMDENNTEVN